MAVHPHAGKLPAPETLENIPALVSAYYTESPDRIRPHNVCLLERPGIVVLR